MRTTFLLKSKQVKSKRVQRAVIAGLERWDVKQREVIEVKPSRDVQEDVLTTIPRRKTSILAASEVSLPTIERVKFRTSRIKAFGRLFAWLTMIAFFVGGNFLDLLLRRDNEVRRAVRLRRAFERAGGTLIKFGQQMAMRVDLLPWAYTVELSKMLDRVPPFPVEQAINVIERSTGKSWEEIFTIFDPDPIGSASVACVYQAILKNGEKVAVKVRRPGVGEIFMADFKVLDWLLDLAEFLTIIRPGTTGSLRKEFQTTLLEELDFVQETRFQDMFRRGAQNTGMGFFTAPKVYFEFSNQEVIVQKFTSGIWLWELMVGVEQNEPRALRRMRELNIDPKKVAERLLWVNYWGMQENIIFHADPHPANVIVRRNSKLTFIDFGSCGSFNREKRAALEQIAVSSANNDPEGMARGSLRLFEPLPPVDLKELMHEAETEYTRVLHVFNSKREHTEWWERTSVQQWMSFFRFAQANNIPLTIHTLRMVRATLLYDTIAARIDSQVDRFEQYSQFLRFREQQARKRFRKRNQKRAKRGMDDTAFLRLEEVAKTSEILMNRAQTLLSSPVLNFGSLVGKWVFTLSTVIKLLGRIFFVTAFTAVILGGMQFASGNEINITSLLFDVMTNTAYLIIITVLVFANARHILFRFGDWET
jgi:predicted unusual protein kinase regulating ubiquinone biosynthesis (AarF/ABC1/UbiB family)